MYSSVLKIDKETADKMAKLTKGYPFAFQVLGYIGMAPNQFSQYREKLIRKGIIDTTKYGYMRLSLPRFKEYAIQRLEYDSL